MVAPQLLLLLLLTTVFSSAQSKETANAWMSNLNHLGHTVILPKTSLTQQLKQVIIKCANDEVNELSHHVTSPLEQQLVSQKDVLFQFRRQLHQGNKYEINKLECSVLLRGGEMDVVDNEYDNNVADEGYGYDNGNSYVDEDDYEDSSEEEPYADKFRHDNDGRQSRKRPKSGGSDNNSASSHFASLAMAAAKKTANVATSATVSSIKGSTRAAVHLATPKHVSRREIVGIWRLDQQIGMDGDGTDVVCCAANVEITPRGDVVTRYHKKRKTRGDVDDDENDTKVQEFQTPYLFTERSWPRSCTIEFEARAFQFPGEDTPTNMLYRATFLRKLADNRIIKMEGKIYSVSGGNSKLLWSRKRIDLVGTFTARRRVFIRQPSGEEEEDDQYEDEDEEAEYDYDESEDYSGEDS